MLESVGEDIEDDLVEVPLVNPEVLLLVGAFQLEVNVPGGRKLPEGLHDVPYEIHNVSFQEMQLHLPVVNLSHVHQLVHEAVDAKGIAVHEVVQFLPGGVLLRLPHLLEWGHYQGERSPYLMGNVREHPQFHFLDIGFLFLPLVQVSLSLYLVQPKCGTRKKQSVGNEGPRRGIEGREHLYRDGGGGVLFLVSVEECPHDKGPLSRGDLGVGGRPDLVVGILPALVEALQPVGIADPLGVGVLQDGESDGEGVVVIGDGDEGGVGNGLVQDVPLA